MISNTILGCFEYLRRPRTAACCFIAQKQNPYILATQIALLTSIAFHTSIANATTGFLIELGL